MMFATIIVFKDRTLSRAKRLQPKEKDLENRQAQEYAKTSSVQRFKMKNLLYLSSYNVDTESQSSMAPSTCHRSIHMCFITLTMRQKLYGFSHRRSESVNSDTASGSETFYFSQEAFEAVEQIHFGIMHRPCQDIARDYCTNGAS